MRADGEGYMWARRNGGLLENKGKPKAIINRATPYATKISPWFRKQHTFIYSPSMALHGD
jgi:hypothetical protein